MTISTRRRDELSPASLADMTAEEKRELLEQLLRRQAAAARCFDMSSGQQGLWYAFRRDPTSTAFNVLLPSRVVSPLDVDALRSAIHFLVARHPCLRTTFSDAAAKLKQTVQPSLLPEFVVIAAEHFDAEELRRQVLAQAQRPFDLETGPLLRMAVFRRGPSDWVILATTHHIVVDFWSLIVFLNELREIYRSFAAGSEPSLPPAPDNYASFVAEQQAMLVGPSGDQQWQYWKQALAGAPPVLNWFTDMVRPSTFTQRADIAALPLSPKMWPQIKRLATEQGTTPAAVVLAALQVFTSRYTREQDFLIGTPFSGRAHQKYEKTVGFFVNVLPLRAELGDNPTFAALVHRVGQNLLASLEHESFPLAEIVRRIQPPRDPSRSPLFQMTCTFEKSHLAEEAGRAGFLMPQESGSADLGGMQQETFYVPHPTCHHDIEFIFEPTDAALRGMICYCRDLFDPATVAQMASNFSGLIENLISSPDLPLPAIAWGVQGEWETSSGPEQRGLTPFSCAPFSCVRDGQAETLTQQIEESFRRHPKAVALVGGGVELTYDQLDRNSRAIALALRARGIGRGDMVPVAGTPGPAITTAIIGVLRSGAAVVPVDRENLAISWSDLIEDTQARLVLVDEGDRWLDAHATNSSVTKLPECPVVGVDELLAASADRPAGPNHDLPQIASSDLAYVIYTSGSTGQPKGVMIEHQSIANTVRWRCEHVSLTTQDRVLMLLSHQFDAGFGIITSTLAQGAALVWPATRGEFDVPRLIDTIHSERVTVLPAVPSQLQLFLRQANFAQCHCIRQIWSGGERMPADLPQQISERVAVQLWNFYGPTEAAVETTAFQVVDHDPRRMVPIGRPIANTQVVVLDDAGRVVPDTVPGQLAIMGRGLARGYLNREDQTAACFVPAMGDAPLSPRMYLTGDLGRRRSDGELEFLGRIDDQVKLRGYRIELEEIESVLRLHPAVKHAAVKVIKPESPSAQLAAYVVPGDYERGDNINTRQLSGEIRRHIDQHLPPHKRPAYVQFIATIPTGSSGKVNRNLLPEPMAAEDADQPAVPPSTPLERHLAQLWSECLEIPSVGVNQNFFQLGGSSLQAAMMTARLSEDLGLHVQAALVFDLADIASIAQRLIALHRPQIEQRFGPQIETPIASSHDPSARIVDALTHPLLAPLSDATQGNPLFMVHPPGGIVLCYRELAKQLEEERPLVAIRSRGLYGQEALPPTIEAMAADYLQAIRSAQSHGPYIVGGWSLGGVIAYEVAKQLIEQGEVIARLILLDSSIPRGDCDSDSSDDSNQVGLEYGIDLSLAQLSELNEDQQLPFLWQHAVNLGVIDVTSHPEVVRHVLSDLKSLFHHHVKLTSGYRLQPLDVPGLLVRPRDVPVAVKTSPDRGWNRWVANLDVKFVSGHHHSMVAQPHVIELAQVIRQSLS